MSPPNGIGIYVRHLSRRIHGDPGSMAARARRAGVSWVALQAAWGLRQSNPLDRLHLYADALTDQGIRTWVWGYPEPGGESQFSAIMRESADAAGADGLLLDPELPYKDRPDDARALLAATMDAMDESLGLGVTSYGLQSFHPRFPWSEFAAAGWGSPQLYTVSDDLFRRGVSQWKALWGAGNVVPSIAAYGPKDEDELPARLRLAGSSVLIWSWRQLSSREWADLEAWRP